MLDKPVEEIPRPGLDTHMIMVDEAHKILQDLRDILGVRLEDNTVPYTDFHVLKEDSGMREIGDT